MPDFETILRNFSGAVCQDQLEEKLRRASHDGTELFYLLIADVIVSKVGKAKAEKVARAILAALKEALND
jgi:hypothetical protein